MRFFHFARTCCGRGYSGSGCFVSTLSPHVVVRRWAESFCANRMIFGTALPSAVKAGLAVVGEPDLLALLDRLGEVDLQRVAVHCPDRADRHGGGVRLDLEVVLEGGEVTDLALEPGAHLLAVLTDRQLDRVDLEVGLSA